MALNFENIGTPIAKILDKNKKELNTVYLADLEIHQKPRHIYETIELQANETFQQIPDNRFKRKILRSGWYTQPPHLLIAHRVRGTNSDP